MNSLTIISKLFTKENSFGNFYTPFFRFLNWQFQSRVLNKALVFKTPDNGRMLLKKDSQIATAFYYYGYPDYEEMNFIKSNINENDLLVDIGANEGGWTILAASIKAKVIAVEPIPETVKLLLENIKLNNRLESRIKILELGLSYRSGFLNFTTNMGTGNGVTIKFDTHENVIKVPVSTLDEIMVDQSPKFIKIDVEGHELQVIKGASSTLKKESLMALIIETFRWANFNNPELIEMEQILLENGFIPVQYLPKLNLIKPLTEKNQGGQNTIYLKKQFL